MAFGRRGGSPSRIVQESLRYKYLRATAPEQLLQGIDVGTVGKPGERFDEQIECSGAGRIEHVTRVFDDDGVTRLQQRTKYQVQRMSGTHGSDDLTRCRRDAIRLQVFAQLLPQPMRPLCRRRSEQGTAILCDACYERCRHHVG